MPAPALIRDRAAARAIVLACGMVALAGAVLVPSARADTWAPVGTPKSLTADAGKVVIDRHSAEPFAMVAHGGTSAALVEWKGSSWSGVWGDGAMPGPASSVAGVIASTSRAHVGWWDSATSSWKVHRNNGYGSWVDTSLPATSSTSKSSEETFRLVGPWDRPVVVRVRTMGFDNYVVVSRWDGAAWVQTEYYSATAVNAVDAWSDGSTVLLAWVNGPTGSNDVNVERFSGGSWASLGKVDATGDGRLPAIASVAGTPWVAFVEDGAVKVRQHVSGTTWSDRFTGQGYPGATYSRPELRSIGGRATLGTRISYSTTYADGTTASHALGMSHQAVYEWWGGRFVHVGGDAYGGNEQVVPGKYIGGLAAYAGRPVVVRATGPGTPALEVRERTRGAATTVSRLLPLRSDSTSWNMSAGCSMTTGLNGVRELRKDVDVADWSAGWCNDPAGSARFVQSPVDPVGAQLRSTFAGLPTDVIGAQNVKARVRARKDGSDGDTVNLTIELRSAAGALLATTTVAAGVDQVHETPPVTVKRADLLGAYVDVIANEASGSAAGTRVSVDSVNIDFEGAGDRTARLRPDGFPIGTGSTLVSDSNGCLANPPLASAITEDVEASTVQSCVDTGISHDGRVKVDTELVMSMTSVALGADRIVRASANMAYTIDPSFDEAFFDLRSPTGGVPPASCPLSSGTRSYCGAAVDWGQAELDALQTRIWWEGLSGQFVHAHAVNVDVLIAPVLALQPPELVDDGPGPGDVDGQTSTSTLQATWTAVAHDDFAGYQYCFTASATGSDCAGTALVGWTATTATSVSRGSLSLAAGSTWYACVRSVHVDTTVTDATCSDGVTVDVSAPGTATLVSPASGSSVTAPPILTATYADGQTKGRVEFQVCATASCSAVTATGSSGVVANGTNGTWTATAGAGTWYWRARNVDAAGNASAWSAAWSYAFTSTPAAALVAPAANAWVTSTQPPLEVRHTDTGGLPGTITVETCTIDAAPPWSTNCGASYQSISSRPGGVPHGETVKLSPNVPLPQGTSFWRARSTNTAGTASAFTASRAVRVDSLHPLPVPTVTFVRSGKGKVDVKWDTATDQPGGVGTVRWNVQAWNQATQQWEPLCTSTTALSCTKAGLGGTELLIARVNVCDTVGNCSDWVGNAAAPNSGYLMRSTASTNLNNAQSRAAVLPPGGTLDSTSTGIGWSTGSGATRTGDFPFRFNTTLSAKQALDYTAPIDPQAPPSGWGWVIDDVENLTLPQGPLGVTVVTQQSAGSAGTVGILCRAWRVQTNGSNQMLSWTHLGDATGSVANVLTGPAAPITSTCTMPNAFPAQTTFANDEVLYVEVVAQSSLASSGDVLRIHLNGDSGSSIDIPRPGQPPLAPDLVSPADGAWLAQAPTLTATYQHPTPRSGTLQFQVATDPAFSSIVGTYTTTLLADDANGSVTATGLAAGTRYYWRVRGLDSGSLTGPWASPARSFDTNSPPAAPTPTAPADGATLTPGTVTLQAGAFSDPDSAAGDSHARSQWQLVVDGGSWATPLVDVTTDTATTSQAIPSPTSGSYRWRVRYRDSLGAWSAWSSERTFTMNAGSLSIGIDTPSIPFGLVVPGVDYFRSAGITVASTSPTGYTLSATDGSDTAALACSCGASIADWSGTDSLPSAWPAGMSGFLGMTVRAASGGRLAKWGDGTGTAETDLSANRYVGLRSTTSTTLHASGAATNGDVLAVTWRINFPAGSTDGVYSGSTVLTAIANP